MTVGDIVVLVLVGTAMVCAVCFLSGAGKSVAAGADAVAAIATAVRPAKAERKRKTKNKTRFPCAFVSHGNRVFKAVLSA